MAMTLLVVMCASWGLQQVSIKVALAGVPPLMQSTVRSAGATLLIWIWMVIRKTAIFNEDGSLGWGILAGLMFAGEFLMIYLGLEYTHASRAVIFLYVSPFVVALGVHLFVPGERMRRLQVVGLCSAFSGILIAFRESVALPSSRMLIGDGMLLGGGILWGATTVVIKASPLSRIAPGKTLFYQLATSAVVLPLGSRLLNEPGVIQLTPVITLCLLYQTVWVAFITYLTWFWLIQNYPASRLASFTFLTPLFGVVAGGLLLKESVSSSLWLALVLVGAGIYLVNRSTGAKPSASGA